VDGQIVLADYKAAAGDLLEITVQGKQGGVVDPSSPGSVLQFEIRLDNFGMNIGPSSSLFFIKRIAVTAGDLNLKRPITPVNFNAAPGASFGFIYHFRSYGKCVEPDRYMKDADVFPHPPEDASDGHNVEHVCAANSRPGDAKSKFVSNKDVHPNFMRGTTTAGGKLLRGLAPGVALNVSFMNWNLPGDYDVSTGKFSTSTSSTVQVGAGFVVSLLDNAAQFTYGWNLQATERRPYWGVGFGFVEVGTKIAGLLKSKPQSGQ
jgi:hypothetical protein